MLITAIVLFVIAATFGSIILTAVLKNKPTPKPVVFLHGPIAGVALLLVIYYMITHGVSTLLLTSIILFVIAAFGGLTMFRIDIMKKKPIPKLIAMMHPLIALAGLITLIIYALQ